MPITLETVEDDGKLVAENQRYLVRDYGLDDLTVSVTELKEGQETRGHSHDSNAEVYVFLGGRGTMVVGEESFPFEEGAVLVPKGKFHKVINRSSAEPLRFLAVFAGPRSRTRPEYAR